jgi:antitoxin component HigA of HigAB toxin-antitoxin module
VFLTHELDYEAYAEAFEEALAELLPESPEKNRAEEAKELARQYARSQPDAVKRVSALFDAAGLDAHDILQEVEAKKAKELAHAYARREPEVIRLVHKLLAATGQTMPDFVLGSLPLVLDQIERIDRLVVIAEARRTISLREIDRRRMVLGDALRRSLQEVEEGEFEVIEPTPAQGQNPEQARGELRTGRSERTPVRGRRFSRH